MNKEPVDFPRQFESERLILRGFHPGDGKWYYETSLRNREHLRRYEADNVAADISDEDVAEQLVCDLAEAWAKKNYFFIAAFDKQTGTFVAQIYVGPVDWKLPEFQIGYFVDVDHEGMGYMTEAVKATLAILFNQLNAHRVHLKCDETNLRSIRVAEHCHMTREGTLRENRRNPDGTYGTSYIYGLLKNEYFGYVNDQALRFTCERSHEAEVEDISQYLMGHWGSAQSTKIVSRGKVTDARQIPRIVARDSDGKLVGLLTYQIDRENQSCEVVTINSDIVGLGIGTKLLGMLEKEAKEIGCRLVWLITTNDNPEAAAFYVNRGYRLINVHLEALNKSRELKPQIPVIGKHGIPLLDEWEFQKLI